MNMLKYLRYLLIDQFVFGIDGDPAPAPADPAPADPAPADPAPSNFFGSLPETWRNDLVSYAGFEGDDATSFANVLERVPDFKSLASNYRTMQDKIRSGEVSRGLPENPTDEQVQAWREANGVPLDPNGYDLNGVELNDFEKEMYENNLLPIAHQHNIPASAMKDIAAAGVAARAAHEARVTAQDEVDSQQGAAVLKEAWGADYQRNLNMVQNFLQLMPEDARERFQQGRLSSGVGIMNDPGVLQFMAHVAAKVNPAATVVPGSENPTEAISQEIARIEKMMRDDPDAYYKDAKTQERLRQLYAAEENMK